MYYMLCTRARGSPAARSRCPAITVFARGSAAAAAARRLGTIPRRARSRRPTTDYLLRGRLKF